MRFPCNESTSTHYVWGWTCGWRDRQALRRAAVNLLARAMKEAQRVGKLEELLAEAEEQADVKVRVGKLQHVRRERQEKAS